MLAPLIFWNDMKLIGNKIPSTILSITYIAWNYKEINESFYSENFQQT